MSNLSEKTLEELQKSISDLTAKLNFVYRTGNHSLIHQLNMAIESYRNAYNNKMNELVKSQKINTKISIDKK